jgi:cytochrome P450
MTDPEAPDVSEAVPTGAELTALDPAFRAGPYPLLTRLRAREPVHYDRVIGRWVLTRADDVERLLRDRTLSVDPRNANDGTYMRLNPF